MDYGRVVEAMGRNGVMKCKGIILTKLGSAILVQPINSRDQVGNCFIEIPLENIDDFIELLNAI